MVTGTSPGQPSQYSGRNTGPATSRNDIVSSTRNVGKPPQDLPQSQLQPQTTPQNVVAPSTTSYKTQPTILRSALDQPGGTLSRTIAGGQYAGVVAPSIEARKGIESVDFSRLQTGQTPTSIINAQAKQAGLIPPVSSVGGVSSAQAQVLANRRQQEEIERVLTLQQQRKPSLQSPGGIPSTEKTKQQSNAIAAYLRGERELKGPGQAILPTGVGLTGVKFTKQEKAIIAGEAYDQKTGQQLRAYTDAEKKALGKEIRSQQNAAIATAGLGTLGSRELALSKDIAQSQAEVQTQATLFRAQKQIPAQIKQLRAEQKALVPQTLPETLKEYAQFSLFQTSQAQKDLNAKNEQARQLALERENILRQQGREVELFFGENAQKRYAPIENKLRAQAQTLQVSGEADVVRALGIQPSEQQRKQQEEQKAIRQTSEKLRNLPPDINQVSQESKDNLSFINKAGLFARGVIKTKAGEFEQGFAERPITTTASLGGQALLFYTGGKAVEELALLPGVAKFLPTSKAGVFAAKAFVETAPTIAFTLGPAISRELKGQTKSISGRQKGFPEVLAEEAVFPLALKAGEVGYRTTVFAGGKAAPIIERAFLKPAEGLEFGGDALRITNLGKEGEPTTSQVIFPSIIKQRFEPTRLGEFFGVKPREEVIQLSPKPVSKLGGKETGAIGELTSFKGEEGLGAGRAFVTRQRFKILGEGERVPVGKPTLSTIELQSRLATGGTQGLTTVQILAGGRPTSAARAKLKTVPTTYAEATGIVGKGINTDFLGKPTQYQIERFVLRNLKAQQLPRPEELSIITREQARFFRNRGEPFGLKPAGEKQLAVLKARLTRTLEHGGKRLEEFAVIGAQKPTKAFAPKTVRGRVPTGVGLLAPEVSIKVPSANLAEIEAPITSVKGKGPTTSLAGPALLAEIVTRPRSPELLPPTTAAIVVPRASSRVNQQFAPSLVSIPQQRLRPEITPRFAQQPISKVEQQILPRLDQNLQPKINQQISPRLNQQVLPQLDVQITPQINNRITPNLVPLTDVPPPPIFKLPGGGGGSSPSLEAGPRVSRRKREYAASLFGVVRGERRKKVPKSGLIKGQPFTGLESRPTVGRGRIPYTTAGFEKFKLPKPKKLPKFKV